jgi:hypothetical protein
MPGRTKEESRDVGFLGRRHDLWPLRAGVTRAGQSVDPTARVTIDRAADRVAVESAADPDAVRRAIETAGYTVQR